MSNPPPTGPTVCPEPETTGAGPGPSPKNDHIHHGPPPNKCIDPPPNIDPPCSGPENTTVIHETTYSENNNINRERNNGNPPPGACVCPDDEEGAIEVEPREEPPNRVPIPDKNIDSGEPPECEVNNNPEPRQFNHKPATGYPEPTQAQRDAPRPPSFNNDLNKLVIMGYQTKRAENALLAADFDLKLALQKLKGQ